MDAAEEWLAANDPNYKVAARAWKHITSGEYRAAREEIPWGDDADLELAVMTGGLLVEHGARQERLCALCHTPFVPYKSDHQFCGDICRAQAKRNRNREWMRRRRAA